MKLLPTLPVLAVAFLAGCDGFVPADQARSPEGEYIELFAAALIEAMTEVGGGWVNGRGGTIVLENEPLERLYPPEDDDSPDRAEIRLAFERVAQSLDLAFDEGVRQEFLSCEDRPGLIDHCEMDERTLLIAPGHLERDDKGSWTVVFSTQHVVDNRRNWRNHLMTFQRTPGGWKPAAHYVGWVN